MTDHPNAHQSSTKGDSALITSVSGVTRTYASGDIVDGAFQLIGLLGQGGMGIVFSCRHLVLHQVYAIKILSGRKLNQDSWMRFQKEARALAKLKHSGIVGIINMGIDDGQFPYYVMDMLEGETLDDLIRLSGRLPVDLALDIFVQVAAALTSAHAQGIIHRDIKPPNLMIVRDEDHCIAGIKIVDFGIARLSKDSLEEQSETKPGRILGSPSYMSPEQCQGLKVDERSDIYSLGCTIFEALTGSPPFLGENHMDTLMLHQSVPAPRMESIEPQETFAPTLEKAVATMLAKDPDRRYQTMDHVKLDLERIKAGKPLLAKFLSAMIAEDRNADAADAAKKKKLKELSNQSDEEDKTEDSQPTANRSKVAIVAAIFTMVSAAVGLGVYNHFAQPQKSTTSANISPPADVLAPTEEIAETRRLLQSNVKEFKVNLPDMERRLERYKERSGQEPFKPNTRGFQFPETFIIGAIRFGDGSPIMATGFVSAPAGEPVYMYLSSYSDTWPDILDKFAPDDLTGLEIVSNDPELVVQKVSQWKHLKELAFFNSLTKALPGEELKYDESLVQNKDLPLIDKLTGLESLGLSSPMVSGDAILQMNLFSTLNALRLKRVTNINPLLLALPQKNNLKEIWLIDEATTDEQLEPLTRMKNLETLKISRGRLTPASLQYFQRMPKLKHLCLEKTWPAAEVESFSKALPCCRFEPVLDFKYWQMFPAQNKS